MIQPVNSTQEEPEYLAHQVNSGSAKKRNSKATVSASGQPNNPNKGNAQIGSEGR
jgi:hypothetical protein